MRRLEKFSVLLSALAASGAALFALPGVASAVDGKPPWQVQIQVENPPVDYVRLCLEGQGCHCIKVNPGSNGTGLFVQPNDYVQVAWSIGDAEYVRCLIAYADDENDDLARYGPYPAMYAPADAKANGYHENFWINMPTYAIPL